MSRESLRVYVVRDDSGLVSGRLISRGETIAATATSEEQLLEKLEPELPNEWVLQARPRARSPGVLILLMPAQRAAHPRCAMSAQWLGLHRTAREQS